jgi:hypothetical protein
VVVQAAANGSGPAAGTRVVTFGWARAWAELRVVDTNNLAVVPEGDDLALADFLRLGPDLLTVAAETSPAMTTVQDDPRELAAWLAALPQRDKDKLLLRVVRDQAAGQVRMELLRRFRGEPKTEIGDVPRRTVAELRTYGRSLSATTALTGLHGGSRCYAKSTYAKSHRALQPRRTRRPIYRLTSHHSARRALRSGWMDHFSDVDFVQPPLDHRAYRPVVDEPDQFVRLVLGGGRIPPLLIKAGA